VLYLGGDAAYAVMLSKLLRMPACAYLGKPRWRKHFATYMVSDDRAERRFADAGIGPERVRVVGHLGLDSVPIRENPPRRTKGDPPIVTFLPGSRPFEIEFMLPFFIETAEIMRERLPDARFHFAVSQFVDRKLIVKCVSRVGARMGSNGDVVSASGCRIRLEMENALEIMSASRLVVTIPGTNNLQLAAMGVPMLIVTPLNAAERIPVDGLLGLLDYRVFPVGLIKRHLILGKRGRVKYVSLPNIIAGREIVPEMLDILQPGQVAERAVSLLNDSDRCAEMVRDLAEIARHGGAARKIAELVLGEEAAVPEGVGSP
jgi:lipid-A-disaccharide synthase